jgi:hypothetical protein
MKYFAIFFCSNLQKGANKFSFHNNRDRREKFKVKILIKDPYFVKPYCGSSSFFFFLDIEYKSEIFKCNFYFTTNEVNLKTNSYIKVYTLRAYFLIVT